MLRIAVCDDDQKILDLVTFHINTYAERKQGIRVEIVCFDHALDLTNALEDKKEFDIFILDIYMGDSMGTQVARTIRKRGISSPIIFLTTSIDHAPESFEMGTLRYLLKPLDLNKFYEAMDAAIIAVNRIEEHYLKLKSENGVVSVNTNHVMYSEAYDHYQYLLLEDGEKIKVRMTVTELFALLSKYNGFERIGSSYIVNLRYVKNISRVCVVLYNNVTIQIPRGKYTEIKNAFWNFQWIKEEL
ncbi:MAG: response regulator transcription factor [Erysipelotrichaceae bacterium]|nr:response regulator transcription factor [Erysipelotrichaceae bacterium]